ncbi:tetratricopeptide repeat protein [Streptomyces sp. NPDC001393]
MRLFHPGSKATFGGMVVWCGTPGGRDDAALVYVDDMAWQPPAGAGVRWGRLVTERPGQPCETWGVPDVAQRPGAAVEAMQLAGTVNPGSGIVGNRYVMDLGQHPPAWAASDSSPWGGLSGAAMFCGRLLTGVIALDSAHSGHAALKAVPTYVLHHNADFRAALAEHGVDRMALEAVELQELAEAEAAVAPGGLASPAALLQAGRQVVSFRGREELLGQLADWCGQGGFGAWLLYGPGGQGKTRLAHHLAAGQAANGWAVLWLRADAPLADLATVRQAAKPLLVVLDYAETRTAQLSALLELAADHGGATALKVLLLARTAGDWWISAQAASRTTAELLDGTPVVALPALEPDVADRPRAYRRAVDAFAAALPGVRGHSGHNWPALAAALPIPELTRAGMDNALTLQMTALVDLLDAADLSPTTLQATVEAADVEDRLLIHERRYWEHSATARGLTPALTTGTLEEALAASVLIGAGTRDQADEVLQKVTALADQPRDRRNAVLSWIAAVYPPTESSPWGTLQPDRLAERFVGRHLEADPLLAHRLVPGTDHTQGARLLTIYSRATAHPVFHGRLDASLTELCVQHVAMLAEHTIGTAIRAERPDPLVAALHQITRDPATSLADLEQLRRHLPFSIRRLNDWAIALTQELSNRYRGLSHDAPDRLPDFAGSLHDLAVGLRIRGRQEEALAAAEESVRIYRALAGTDPDTHLPALARSLNNLASMLADRGLREEALAAFEETVTTYRTLSDARPDTYLLSLALSLANLSVLLRHLGWREESLAALEEAVRIYRAQAETNADTHLPAFAESLHKLARTLSDLGRRDEALTALEEAVRIYRALAEADPDTHLSDLAGSLNNLSVILRELGRPEEALAVIEEAATAYRTLANFRPAVARCMENLARVLADLERREEALTALQEAVLIYRAVSEADPDTHLSDLAGSLNNLSVILRELGRLEEALAVIEEAVTAYRTLANSLSGDIRNLTNPPARTGLLRRWRDARAVVKEALRIRRTLAGSHLPGIPPSLTGPPARTGVPGLWRESRAAAEKAVRVRRTFAATAPDTHLPELARSLYNLSALLRNLDRREEALTALEEAVRIYRALTEANPEFYEHALEQSLEAQAQLQLDH